MGCSLQQFATTRGLLFLLRPRVELIDPTQEDTKELKEDSKELKIEFVRCTGNCVCDSDLKNYIDYIDKINYCQIKDRYP